MSEIVKDLFSLLLALGGIIFLAGMLVSAAREYKWGVILLIGGAILIILGAAGQDSAKTRIELTRVQTELATQQEQNEVLAERLARTRDHGGSFNESVVNEATDALSFAAYISGLGVASALIGMAGKKVKKMKSCLGAISMLVNLVANVGVVAVWVWSMNVLGRVAHAESATVLMAAMSLGIARLGVSAIATIFDVASSLLLWLPEIFPEEEN